MRVISGFYKGLKLEEKYSENIRPTTDKIKESLFNILQFELENKSFLDLFGGTGQIGIEAASRGAGKVVIVDESIDSFNIIKKNVSKIKRENNIFVIHSSSSFFLKTNKKKFDIVFMDPPYLDTKLLYESLLKIENHMNKNGILIVESLKHTEILSFLGDFVLQNKYRYGKIALSVFRTLD